MGQVRDLHGERLPAEDGDVNGEEVRVHRVLRMSVAGGVFFNPLKLLIGKFNGFSVDPGHPFDALNQLINFTLGHEEARRLGYKKGQHRGEDTDSAAEGGHIHRLVAKVPEEDRVADVDN